MFFENEELCISNDESCRWAQPDMSASMIISIEWEVMTLRWQSCRTNFHQMRRGITRAVSHLDLGDFQRKKDEFRLKSDGFRLTNDEFRLNSVMDLDSPRITNETVHIGE